MSAVSDSNGFHPDEEVIDDPEIQAELDYAEQNGLDMSTIRMRLKKAKTLSAVSGGKTKAESSASIRVFSS